LNQRAFNTENLDLAAFLTAAGYEPVIYRNPGDNRATFEFAENEELIRWVVDYERGAALPAKRVLNARSRMYREASEAVRGGRR